MPELPAKQGIAMSVTAVPIRPIARGSVVKLWIGLLLLCLAAAGVAWAGTQGTGATTTASGLRIQTIEEGDGASPTVNDVVLIDYEGKLADGTVFDSTEGRQPLPLPVTGSIPGFTEALLLMKKGGTYRIWLPSDLAYGPQGTPGGPIPPNADLEFRVKLLDFAPQSALQGMAPPAGDPHSGGM